MQLLIKCMGRSLVNQSADYVFVFLTTYCTANLLQDSGHILLVSSPDVTLSS